MRKYYIELVEGDDSIVDSPFFKTKRGAKNWISKITINSSYVHAYLITCESVEIDDEEFSNYDEIECKLMY